MLICGFPHVVVYDMSMKFENVILICKSRFSNLNKPACERVRTLSVVDSR